MKYPLGLLAAGIVSQNAIADIGKWSRADTRVLAEAHAASAVFTGAAFTGVADGSALAAKSDAATLIDAVTLPPIID